MAYIICEPCVGTCDTACVEVCPVDCIHGPYDKEGAGAEAKVDGFVPKDEDSLYIDPAECIDCGACEPECPVEAIFEESEVPEEWNKYIKINYDWFGREYPGQTYINISWRKAVVFATAFLLKKWIKIKYQKY